MNIKKLYILPCNQVIFSTIALLLQRIGFVHNSLVLTEDLLKEYYKLNNVIKICDNTFSLVSEYSIPDDNPNILCTDITFIKNNKDFLEGVITDEEGDIFQKYFDILGQENLFPPISEL